MTGLEEALFIGAVVGGSGSMVGLTAWVGQRLYAKLDKIQDTLSGDGGHTARLAVIESKLPNGEWKLATETLERVEQSVEEVKVEQVRVREELRTHIADEESRVVNLVDRLRDNLA